MFVSVYQLNLTIKDSGRTVAISPLACFSIEKFKISYASGDYEELPDIEIVRKAKQFFRSHLGCKFEGDLNPATGNTVYDVHSDTAPCTHLLVLEREAFSRKTY